MNEPARIGSLLLIAVLAGCPIQRAQPETSGTIEAQQRPEDKARIRALESEVRRLEGLLRAAQDPGTPAMVEPEPVAPSLAATLELHSSGDVAGAVTLGLELLDLLNDGGVDAPRLAAMLGEWALEIDEAALAERLFGEAAAAVEAMAPLAEESRIREAVARAAALGPDAAALAEAEALQAVGELGQATVALGALIEEGEDEAVVARAAELRQAIRDEAIELAVERLDRADSTLAGDGPYEAVDELLTSVEALPEGTWDPSEVRRLRAWYRSRSRESGAEDAAIEGARVQAMLEEARGHVAAERYREAVTAYRSLDGTSLQTQAREESRAAVDTLVKTERERAGRMFMAARKKPDADLRRAALEEVAVLLRGLLQEFPESTYASRVRDNLSVVEKELGAP